MGKVFNLENVVLVWPQVFTPRTSKMYPKNAAKFSVVCRLDVNSPNHIAVYNAMQEVATEAFPDGSAGMPKLKPSVDGLTIEIRASARAEDPPGVIDGSKNEILNPAEIYSGVIANVAIDVYPSTDYRKVCIGVLGIQKVKDGPRVDNKPDVGELFAPISTISTPQPGAAPVAPVAPVVPGAPVIGNFLG